MANLLLRSPQYKQTSAVGMLSANIDISIDSILRYSITKNAINNVVVFDISENESLLPLYINFVVELTGIANKLFSFPVNTFLYNVFI